MMFSIAFEKTRYCLCLQNLLSKNSGAFMFLAQARRQINEKEYLQGELVSGIKHKLILEMKFRYWSELEL